MVMYAIQALGVNSWF